MVNPNQTGTSLINGEINISNTNTANLPIEEDQEEINEFEIEFEDSKGDKKILKIRYR